jgi:hypothetical protein
MKLYEYLARCVEERDPAWAKARVEEIDIDKWNRDDTSLVFDSIKFSFSASDSDMLKFCIRFHDTKTPNRYHVGMWEVRPSLIHGLTAMGYGGDCSLDSWIEECLLDELGSHINRRTT